MSRVAMRLLDRLSCVACRVSPVAAAIRSERLAALLLVVLLVSCRVPGAVRPTVKIGLVAPFEGRYRYVGYDLFPAVRLALREVNGAGGVGGYAVELVAYEDGSDPEMASWQARKLGVDPEVVAVVGHFRQETTMAALPVYADLGLPLVASGVLSPSVVEGGGGVFWLDASARAVAAALLDGVDGAVLVDDGGWLGQALLEASQGEPLALVVSPDDPDWLGRLLAAAPSAVLCSADPVTAGEVAAALRGGGWGGEFLGGPELMAADFPAVAGGAAEGAILVTPWPYPGDVEGGEEFIASYTRLSWEGTPPGPTAWLAYGAVRLVLEALEADVAADGVPSRAGVATALASVTGSRAARVYWYRIEGGAPVRLSP